MEKWYCVFWITVERLGAWLPQDIDKNTGRLIRHGDTSQIPQCILALQTKLQKCRQFNVCYTRVLLFSVLKLFSPHSLFIFLCRIHHQGLSMNTWALQRQVLDSFLKVPLRFLEVPLRRRPQITWNSLCLQTQVTGFTRIPSKLLQTIHPHWSPWHLSTASFCHHVYHKKKSIN